MTDKPKTRWFRFRLRTLFVVVAVLIGTVLASRINYQYMWIQQRHQFLATHNVSWGFGGGCIAIAPGPAPGLLGTFGVLAAQWINVHSLVDGQLAKTLFPEASILIGRDPPDRFPLQ